MGSCCKPEEYTRAQQHVAHKPGDAIHESVKVCTKGLATELLWPWPHTGGMLLITVRAHVSSVWSYILRRKEAL